MFHDKEKRKRRHLTIQCFLLFHQIQILESLALINIYFWMNNFRLIFFLFKNINKRRKFLHKQKARTTDKLFIQPSEYLARCYCASNSIKVFIKNSSIQTYDVDGIRSILVSNLSTPQFSKYRTFRCLSCLLTHSSCDPQLYSANLSSLRSPNFAWFSTRKESFNLNEFPEFLFLFICISRDR